MKHNGFNFFLYTIIDLHNSYVIQRATVKACAMWTYVASSYTGLVEGYILYNMTPNFMGPFYVTVTPNIMGLSYVLSFMGLSYVPETHNIMGPSYVE